MKKIVRAALSRVGWELQRSVDREQLVLADLSAADRAIVSQVDAFTMTSLERRASLLGAVDHVVRHGVPGDIVECGVWRGGSMMLVALVLMARGDTSRDLYLFDTFEGMSAPTGADRTPNGEAAEAQLLRADKAHPLWAVAGIDDVRANLAATGYPAHKVHFVKGKVEDTIPSAAPLPACIALLRLDTDWYESTRHELKHLYPLLTRHGVLVIDDYGHWQGARQAVDEYFADAAEPVFLHRVDYTARLLVKTHGS
jgi:O-methyltransferase